MEKYEHANKQSWTDPDGYYFEITPEKGKFGYHVLVQSPGKNDLGKNGQAELIFQGPDGYMYIADSNGSVFGWKKKWQYLVKDNKEKAGIWLKNFGQPNIYIGETAAAPSTIKTTTQKTMPLQLTPISKTVMTAVKPVVADLMAPVVPAGTTAKQIVDAAIQQLPPPESSLGLPLGGTSPLFMQQGSAADPTKTAAPQTLTASAGSLTPSKFSFSNPWIIGGMIAGVIVLVILAKKFG